MLLQTHKVRKRNKDKMLETVRYSQQTNRKTENNIKELSL